ncbi:MAG TPA: class I SAM-dependent methyltransferase [Chloroflexota bacterium]
MVLRFHEIAEAEHRILNPYTEEKLRLLGMVCRLQEDQRLLDLCCGKGEMLSTWSRDHGIGGVGVDISEVFLTAARQRAAQLQVEDRVRFVHSDASTYRNDAAPYDLVSCIGATWIGGGPGGTIDLIRPLVRAQGLVLIGEPYWITPPTPEAEDAMGHGFTSLAGTLERFAAVGAELIEMVMADHDSWDRYVAAQWWTVTQWLRDHPDHPDHEGMQEFLESGRRSYVTYGRQQFGWGVFVLRLSG